MANSFPNITDIEFPVRYRGTICNIDSKDMPIKMQRYDVRRTSPELIVHRAGNADWNRKAATRQELLPADLSTNDKALYVVAVEGAGVSKIGVAERPLFRLKQLQTGSHARLTMPYLLWLPSKQAFGLESLVLRVMAKLGKKLVGEWCDMRPSEAALVVATTTTSNEAIHVADSQMHNRNMKRLIQHDPEGSISMAYHCGANPERLLANRG